MATLGIDFVWKPLGWAGLFERLVPSSSFSMGFFQKVKSTVARNKSNTPSPALTIADIRGHIELLERKQLLWQKKAEAEQQTAKKLLMKKDRRGENDSFIYSTLCVIIINFLGALMALRRKKVLEKEIANTENVRYNLELQVCQRLPFFFLRVFSNSVVLGSYSRKCKCKCTNCGRFS